MSDLLRYELSVVTISAGQAVRWRNPSAVIHTVTVDPSKAMQAANVRLPSGVAAFDSGDIGPGGEFHVDVRGARRVPVRVHPTRGSRHDRHHHGSVIWSATSPLTLGGRPLVIRSS